ncbi:hypothetical protein GA0061098_102131 [Bradyrhizobium shewense]|uniref:Uncharacterized protein n=2 Tax=Bradyrhizobium shewense TaxID=1761772 RepID=A0A1C3XP85_9BRAD|nr:hypothetical protein GA0061098_102131 [Bradyrhizobium shewense]
MGSSLLMEPPSSESGTWATAIWVKKFTQSPKALSAEFLNTSVGAGIAVRNPNSQRNGDISFMTIAPPLWDSEPLSNTSSSAFEDALKGKPEYRDRYRNGFPTDVLEWLKQNEPADFAELMDLRKSLYARRTTGKYRIRLGGLTYMGEQKMLLTGPASAVLILSDKARHFLLRTLCRLRRARRWQPIRYRR